MLLSYYNVVFILSFLTLPTFSSPVANNATNTTNTNTNDTNNPRAVIVLHIFGNTYEYTLADWQREFDLASETGIDAFAFGVAQDPWRDHQLDMAFSVAEKSKTKALFSVDFAATDWTQDQISALLNYTTKAGYYRAPGKGGSKPMVTSFNGRSQKTVDWAALKATYNIYTILNLGVDEVESGLPAGTDGPLNWNSWASHDNQPIDGNVTIADDQRMTKKLNQATQSYMSQVSGWFFSNYRSAGLTKSWVFKSDDLLRTRWEQMITCEQNGFFVDFIQLYSWNDYGESNYINNIQDARDSEFSGGDDRWAKGFNHTGWRLLDKLYIKAFKAYKTSVSATDIDTEMVLFSHRPYPAKTMCSNQTEPIKGSEFLQDQIVVISTLKSNAQLEITSGGQTSNFNVDSAVQTTHMKMSIGSQSVKITRNGKSCGEATSSVKVSATCDTPNYNANVETIIVKCSS